MVKKAKIIHLVTDSDSIVRLPQSIIVRNYVVSVISVSGFLKDWNPKKILYLCSDMCTDSIVGTEMRPVLCPLNLSVRKKNEINIDNIQNPIYVEVSCEELRVFNLYICDEFGMKQSFQNCKLNCSLLFIPVL